ncbi:MAG: tetratricopeptide repeat protein [Fluviicola sp.]
MNKLNNISIITNFVFWIFFFSIQSNFAQSETELIQSVKKEQSKERIFKKTLELANYYSKNNLKKADSIRYQLIDISRNLEANERVQAIIFGAKLDYNRGNKDNFYAEVIELQPLLMQIDLISLKCDVLHEIALYSIETRDYPMAEMYVNRAQKLALKLRNYKLTAENYRIGALLYQAQNDKLKSIEWMGKALQYSRRSADKSLMANCLKTQAEVYEYFGQIELSVSKNIVALQIAKEAGDFPLVVTIQLELGRAQLKIQNITEAYRYFYQAKETAEKINSNHLVALSKMNLGPVFVAKKDYSTALTNLKSAIKVLQQSNDNEGLGIAYMYLGNVLMAQEKYDEALTNYNFSLIYFESAGNRVEISTVYYLVGIVFEKQKKYTNALNYLNRAIEKRSQFGNQGDIYLTYKEIAKVYKQTGKIELAHKYLEMYTAFADSAKTVEVSAKIAEISELYRSEQREKLIAIQQDSIVIQKNKQELTSAKLENSELKSRSQTYVILTIIVLLIAAGFILYSRNKQKNIQALQQEAEMNQRLLRSQMNPHFVFNAMSVIQSYIYDHDTKNSTKFLVNFSKLMRLILENSSKEFIPIELEQEILVKYMETQKLRFGDRFEYEVRVSDEVLEIEGVIPPMITQPFIENAIEHGQLHTVENGFIHVTIQRENEMLHITIEDNGIGRKASEKNKKSKEHKSMAMKITQDRINNLNYKYKIEGRMEFDDYNKEAETGTLVNIYLPFKSSNEVTT